MENQIGKSLSELVVLENKYELDTIRISNLPIWNIIKYDIRRKFLLYKGICETLQSVNVKISFKQSMIGMWKSLYGFLKICIAPKKVDNIIMGFSRLDNINGMYIDRFTDPVIDLSKLKDNYIYFEYGRTGMHMSPRKNIKRVVYTDFIYLFSLIWGYSAAIPIMLLNYRELQQFKKCLVDVTSLDIKLFYLSRIIAEFKCNACIFEIIITRLNAKRVFGVSRILFKHASFAAKKKNLSVYEFQHGITLSNTELYSGNYIPEIDPDYFLLFGDSCPRDVFGIPKELTINIGWAFKQYIKGLSNDNKFTNCCLVISEPQISNQIIEATLILAKHNPHINFHIRRHPQESFTVEQKSKFESTQNVIDCTNKKNSLLVVMAYDYIIGENSTVLYEGLSLGKKVARLNICGLHPLLRNNNDSFYYIDRLEDFEKYINAPVKKMKADVYSDFNVELFNSFLK